MKKTWFMAPMEYSPYGKGIMASMEYTLMVYNLNGKGLVLSKFVFENGNRCGNLHSKR